MRRQNQRVQRSARQKKDSFPWLRRSILWILALALLLGACSSSGTRKEEKAAVHTVTDCAGRRVEVPDEINSISCLYAYAGHACVFMGCEDKITSVVNGLTRDQLMRRKIPEIDSLPAPYQEHAINIEELMDSSPDVILLRQENLADDGEVKKLDKTGIPYVVIDYSNMAEQRESIRVIGETLGTEEAAEEYLEYYQDTLDFVAERVAEIPENERKTVYHSVNEVIRSDIKDTLSYEILAAAGLRNVIDLGEDGLTMDGNKAYSTVEQIYTWDPDLVLCNETAAWEYFQTDAKFAGLRAVREGAVYRLPIGLSRWGHPGSIETPLAVLYIARLVYPEAFADVDMEEETLSFYERFVHETLSPEEIAEIFSGYGMREEQTKNEQ